MRGICVHAGMPGLDDFKTRHGDWQVKGPDLADRGRLAIGLRDRADQIGSRRNCNNRWKARHDQPDITIKIQLGERPVDGTGIVGLRREDHMATGGIARSR